MATPGLGARLVSTRPPSSTAPTPASSRHTPATTGESCSVMSPHIWTVTPAPFTGLVPICLPGLHPNATSSESTPTAVQLAPPPMAHAQQTLLAGGDPARQLHIQLCCLLGFENWGK